MQELFTALDRFGKSSADLKEFLPYILKDEDPKKGVLLHEANKRCNRIWFIASGIIRIYTDFDGKETTRWILEKDDFMIATDSFPVPKVSKLNIVVEAKARVLSTTLKQLHEATRRFPEFDAQYKLIDAHYRQLHEEHADRLQRLSEKEMVEWFLANRRHLLNVLSRGAIASYLGITVQTLGKHL